MPLITEAQIATFEKALQGEALKADPDWTITKLLIESVRVLANRAAELEAQRRVLLESGLFAESTLTNSLRAVLGAQPRISLSEQEVQAAIDNLNEAVRAAQAGQKIAEYAGKVLKFVAGLVF